MTRDRDPWQVVTHAGNRDAQLDSTLAATVAQRLAWLEAALRLAHGAGRDAPQPDPTALPGRRGDPE